MIIFRFPFDMSIGWRHPRTKTNTRTRTLRHKTATHPLSMGILLQPYTHISTEIYIALAGFV